jgi:hypothetical protein
MSQPDPAALQRLLDKQAIRDVLARYARGVDRRDWNLIRAAFHPDARDDHGAYRGDVEGLIKWVERRHASIDQSMHFLGNCLVEFADDDRALVETCYVAFLRLGPDAHESRRMLLGDASEAGDTDLAVLGRYIDRFERRDGDWRIARRINVYEGTRAQAVRDPSRDPQHDWATRDRSDKLYTMWRDVFGTPD